MLYRVLAGANPSAEVNDNPARAPPAQEGPGAPLTLTTKVPRVPPKKGSFCRCALQETALLLLKA